MISALVKLARPKMLPYVLLLVFGGYGWGHWDRGLTMRHPEKVAIALVAWTLLHAGTLWLNAALDKDEGAVLFSGPVKVPDGIAAWGYAALVACVAIACLAGPWVGFCGAACALLAVLYSHPRTAWKGHPIGGPIVNVVGYGLLSPMAGFACVDVTLTERTVAAWVMGAVGIFGTYVAAQAFQADEDRARGYRTLVVTHGARFCIVFARACYLIGLSGAVILAVIGWFPRILLAGIPLFVWVDWHAAAWAALPDGGTEKEARELARRLLITGLVAIALAFVEYGRSSYWNEPVAGLGTASGHPPDRPLLPPDEMREWEARNGVFGTGH